MHERVKKHFELELDLQEIVMHASDDNVCCFLI